MKIAYVLNAYLPESVGGTEFYTAALAEYMKAHGQEPVIVSPSHDRAAGPPPPGAYQGIPVRRYAEPSVSSRKLILGLAQPAGLGNFIELIRTEKPDVVHFQMISSGANVTSHHVEAVKKLGFVTGLTLHLALYTCLTETLLVNNQAPCDGRIDEQKCTACYLVNRGVSVVMANCLARVSRGCCHALGHQRRLCALPGLSVGTHVRALQQRLGQLSTHLDFMIPIVGWYKEMLLKNGVPAPKLRLIPQGLIANTPPSGAQPVGLPPPVLLAYIGRIAPVKGLLVLLKAMAQLPREAYRLAIYGATDPRDPYFRLCQQFIQDNCLQASFRGVVPRRDITAALQQSHVLCLPSLFSEMAPLVIQEAFFAGIPVLGTDVAGISEWVRHGQNGLLFPFGDHEALGRLLSGLLEQPQALVSLRKNVVPPESFAAVGQATLALYEEFNRRN